VERKRGDEWGRGGSVKRDVEGRRTGPDVR
jgi:hypothetical protein